MKKRLLCLLLVLLAVVCLHTSAFADEVEYIDQILPPLGGGYMDEEGNFILDAPAEEILLTADFVGKKDAVVSWCVLDGKDVVAIRRHENSVNEGVLTALSNGTASIMAYLEDNSQSVIVGKVIVSEQPETQTNSVVTVTTKVKGAGYIHNRVDAQTTENWYIGKTLRVPLGTELDLIAQETKNPFKYWIVRDAYNKETIVSKEKNYKLKVGTDVTLEAVFDQTDDGSFFGTNVTFLYNNLVASNQYILGKALQLEKIQPPYQRNKVFEKWVSKQADADAVWEDKALAASELTQATVFEASYTDKEVQAEILVVGGSGSGTYAYGEAVVAQVTDAPQDGKQFLFWSKDGAPVSYDTTYAFSAMQDCTVTAVFGAAVETDGINMVMQTPVEDGDVIAFTFERYVPEGYDFISSGFIVGEYESCMIGDAGNYMEGVSYRNGTRTQFTKSLTKKSDVTTYYARGYVIYKDGDAVKTIYTPAQKIVIE